MTSCDPKKEVAGCTDPLAENYNSEASNDNGSCIYPREKFLGAYSVVSDNCEDGTYTITILASSQAMDKIIIDNLNDVNGLSLVAAVTGSSFVIQQTTINGQTLSGNGQLNGNVLTFTYAVDEPGYAPFSCSGSANKQ